MEAPCISEMITVPQSSSDPQLSSPGATGDESTPYTNPTSIFGPSEMFSTGTYGHGYTPTPLYFNNNGCMHQLFVCMMNEESSSLVPNRVPNQSGGLTYANINCVGPSETFGGALEIPPVCNGFMKKDGNITEKHVFPEKPGNHETRQLVKNRIYSQEIRQKLDLFFSVRKYLSPSQAVTIAEQVGLTSKQVYRYFQLQRNNATARRNRALKKLATRNSTSDNMTA